MAVHVAWLDDSMAPGCRGRALHAGGFESPATLASGDRPKALCKPGANHRTQIKAAKLKVHAIHGQDATSR